MSTTQKRITLPLTKKDIEDLERLMAEFDETMTKVFKRALILLTYTTFNNNQRGN